MRRFIFFVALAVACAGTPPPSAPAGQRLVDLLPKAIQVPPTPPARKWLHLDRLPVGDPTRGSSYDSRRSVLSPCACVYTTPRGDAVRRRSAR